MGRWSLPAGAGKWVELSGLVLLLGIGVAARCCQIGYNFDYDEVFSTQLASHSFGAVIAQSLADRPHPPLFNILLHLWILAFGASETATRLLGVVLSAGFLVSAYVLCRRATPPRIALACLAILAVSPFFIFHGQQVRPYALIALLATLNMLAFVHLLEAPQEQRRSLLWAASGAVLLYAQYLGGLLIVVEMAFAVVRLREQRLRIVLYGLGAFALIGPWFVAAMSQPLFQGVDPLPHISWMRRPQPVDFLFFYFNVFGTIPGIRFRWLLGLIACAGAWYLCKAIRARAVGREESFLLVVAFVIPAVVYALSVWGPKAIFQGRQMIAAAVAFVAVLGLFASALRKGLDVLFLVVVVAWTVAAMPQGFPQASKPPWRQIAADVNQRYGTETVVVLEEWVEEPLRLYRGGNPVRRWVGLTDEEKGKRFLLLCRPALDTPPGLDSRARRELLATWRPRPVRLASWWPSEPTEPNPFTELVLYEVVPSGQPPPPGPPQP